MTVVGASDVRQRTVTVDTVGRIQGEGWVKVAEFDPSRWNPPESSGGRANVVVVCWADVGGVAITSNANALATIDIALGLSRGPWEIDYRQTATVGLEAESRVAAQKGAPWFWVWHRTAAAGDDWPLAAGDVPALWARISTNGGPVTGTDASFKVANVGWLAFYVDDLDARQAALVDRPAGNQGIRLPDAQANPASILADTGALSGTVLNGSGRYLGFASIELGMMTDGLFPLQGPRLWVEHLDASESPPNDVVRVLGADNRWGMLHSGPLARRGMIRYRMGSLFVVDDPAAGDSFRIRGIDTHGSALWRADYFGSELFLLHTGNLGSFASTDMLGRLDAPARIFNDPDVPAASFLPLEQTRPFHADVVSVGAGAFWYDGLTLVHRMALGLSGGTRATSALYTQTLSTREAPILHVGREDRGLGSSAFRHELAAFAPPWYQGQQRARAGTDVVVAAWSWENDPNFVPTPVAETPSRTWLVPGRESLDPGSLPTLPASPSRAVRIVDEEDSAELDTLDPIRPRWPLYLAPRRRGEITWPALSRPQRLAVDAFFAANRTFALQLEIDDDPIAVVLSAPLQVADLTGGLFSIRAQFVELIWTGGA